MSVTGTRHGCVDGGQNTYLLTHADWNTYRMKDTCCRSSSVPVAVLYVCVQEEIAKGKDVEEKESGLPFPHWICQPYVRPA